MLATVQIFLEKMKKSNFKNVLGLYYCIAMITIEMKIYNSIIQIDIMSEIFKLLTIPN